MLGRSHGRHLSRGVTQVSQSPSGCKYGTAWRGETEAGRPRGKEGWASPSRAEELGEESGITWLSQGILGLGSFLEA